jgi:hypothetical protein
MPGVINSLSAAGLPLRERTIADELRARGYKTVALGKWHLGQQPQYLPQARGFDAFLGLPFSVDDGEGYAPPCANASDDVGGGAGLGPQLALPLIRQRTRSGGAGVANESVIVEQPTNIRQLTSRLVSFAKNFTQLHANSPFFVYFAFGHVHTATPNVDPASNPWNGKQYAGCAFAGHSRRGLFGDAMAEVDNAVETLVGRDGWIASLGLARNTLVLFTSDNGPSLRWGLAAGSPGIFTGQAAAFANGTRYTNTAKGSTWEGGIRMPAFAFFPGTIEPGTWNAEVISTMDVFPSLLKMIDGGSRETIRSAERAAGAAAIAFDGKSSLWDILVDNTGTAASAHAFLPFYNNPNISLPAAEIFAARMGKYKAHWITSPGLGGGRYPTSAEHDRMPAGALRKFDPPLVFDIEADPSEMLPLAAPPAALLAALAVAKAEYEAALTPVAINPAYGYEWALCCGVGCVAPCDKCSCRNAPLPPAEEARGARAARSPLPQVKAGQNILRISN